MHLPWRPMEGVRDFGNLTNGERLTLQLRRLLVRGRFGPMALWLRDGRRVNVRKPEDVRVHHASGTIDVTSRGDVSKILSEELLAIELRPRAALLGSLSHAGPTT